MDVYVFSPDLDLLGIVERVASVDSTLRWNDAGTLTVVCANTSFNRELLALGRVIGLRQSRRLEDADALPYAGLFDGFLLETLQFALDAEGEAITATGLGLPALLGWRVVPEKRVLAGDSAALIDALVAANAAAPSDPARALPHWRVAGGFTGKTVARDVDFEPLLDVVRSLAASAATGFAADLCPARREIRFRQFRGLDRSAGRFGAFPLLDESPGSLRAAAYRHDRAPLRTTAYVLGAEVDGVRPLEPVGDSLRGLARREMPVDAPDLRCSYYEDDLLVTLSDADYRALLAARGADRLRDHPAEERLDADLDPAAPLLFRRDFFLGDLLPVRSRACGVSAPLRLTALRERLDGDGLTVTPTLGDEAPTLITRLRRRLA